MLQEPCDPGPATREVRGALPAPGPRARPSIKQPHHAPSQVPCCGASLYLGGGTPPCAGVLGSVTCHGLLQAAVQRQWTLAAACPSLTLNDGPPGSSPVNACVSLSESRGWNGEEGVACTCGWWQTAGRVPAHTVPCKHHVRVGSSALLTGQTQPRTSLGLPASLWGLIAVAPGCRDECIRAAGRKGL